MKLRVFQCSFTGEGTGECAIAWVVGTATLRGWRDFVSMIVFNYFICRRDSLYDRGVNERESIFTCFKREPAS